MLQFDDIQAYILTGYGHKEFSCFLFYEITDDAQARGWIREIVPGITSAKRRAAGEPKPETGVNVAFTVGGLKKLGLDAATIANFPREFGGGPGYDAVANPMAMPASSQILEDIGDSAPEHWHFGGPSTPPVHVLLMLFGTTEETLGAVVRKLTVGDDHGLRLVYEQHSNRLGQKDAFGFHDGISQPGIEGSYIPTRPGQQVVKAGEFVLGYIDEYGMSPPSPTVAARLDPSDILPALDGKAGTKDLGKNGTYIAVRKLSQDVEGFWGFCAQSTLNPDGSENEEKKVWLAAKMMGRWPSGAPMALAPDKDDPTLGNDTKRNNDFLYADDPRGLKCPMGSHVRRANPRDNLPPDNPETSMKVSNRHRIIRRGRPYNDADGDEKGLMFMAMNTDIQRQFEFVQQTWLNNPKFGHMYVNKDPIVSDPQLLDLGPDGIDKSVMHIPARPVRQRVHGLKRFVEVKGGGYYFLPSLRALRFLGNDQGKNGAAASASSSAARDSKGPQKSLRTVRSSTTAPSSAVGS